MTKSTTEFDERLAALRKRANELEVARLKMEKLAEEVRKEVPELLEKVKKDYVEGKITRERYLEIRELLLGK